MINLLPEMFENCNIIFSYLDDLFQWEIEEKRGTYWLTVTRTIVKYRFMYSPIDYDDFGTFTKDRLFNDMMLDIGIVLKACKAEYNKRLNKGK